MNLSREQFENGLRADLARHAAFGVKVSGGEGDLATAAWIAERLASLGYAVARDDTRVPYFDAQTCRLQAGGLESPVLAQAPVVPTGPEGVSGPLACVRTPDDAADAEAAIALVVLPYGRHASLGSPLVQPLLDATVAARPRAIVLVPTGPTGDVVAMNAPLRSAHGLPLAVLAPRALAPFLAAARNRAPAQLVLDGEVSQRSTPTLSATLRRGPRWLCLSTPRTGWFTCASERGTGTAAFLAMAAWAVHRFPGHSIFAVNTGAHEYLFAGAHTGLARAPAPAETEVWIHLGAGLAARGAVEIRGRVAPLPSADPQRFTMATASLQKEAREAFAGLPGLEHVEPPVDGVSELAVIARDYPRAMGVLGVPRVFHTPADTLEATDAALLAPVVMAHMAVMEAAVKQAGAAAR